MSGLQDQLPENLGGPQQKSLNPLSFLPFYGSWLEVLSQRTSLLKTKMLFQVIMFKLQAIFYVQQCLRPFEIAAAVLLMATVAALWIHLGHVRFQAYVSSAEVL